MNQLSYRTDTTIAKVVNVVGLVTLFTIMQRYDIAHGFDDVFLGKSGIVVFRIKAKLLVDLITTNLCQVVALWVEEQTIQKRTS